MIHSEVVNDYCIDRFSGGPTSQLETIELRGFDEPIKKNGTTNSKDEVGFFKKIYT